MSEGLKQAKADEYSDEVDNICKRYYRNPYFLPNNVLGKVTIGNRSYQKLLKNESIRNTSILVIFGNLTKYYAKNFYLLLVWVVVKLYSYMFIRNRYKVSSTSHLVDISVDEPMMIKSKNVDDRYFSLLTSELSRKKIDFIYVPTFYNSTNPGHLISCLKIMSGMKQDFLSEFDLLSALDVLKVFIFILLYPLYIISLASKISSENDVLRAIKNDLYLNLGDVVLKAYVKYLLGKKLNIFVGRAKYLSYCEYRPIDKCLYRGIKESNSDIIIYAYQSFLKCKLWLNPFIPPFPSELKITPDFVIPNGKCNINESLGGKYKLPISLRYSHIFDGSDKQVKYDFQGLVVLLSFVETDALAMLNMLRRSDLNNLPIHIKPHPNNNINKITRYLLPGWNFSDRSVSTLLSAADIVVVTGSGTAVEALVKGVSVILYVNEETLELNPIIYNVGRGEVWDIVHDEEQLIETYKSLLAFRVNVNKVYELSEKIRDNMFSAPTGEAILDSFDYIK